MGNQSMPDLMRSIQLNESTPIKDPVEEQHIKDSIE